jgi:cell volume regulation protein A
MTPHLVVFTVGLLVFLSIFASKISGKFGLPVLLMFLAIGMLAGADGPGGIYFDNAEVANLVGTFALAFILFSGGIDTNWDSVRPVLGNALALATLGVALTAALVGIFAWKVLGFDMYEGFLLGSIVSSTDAAAVFAVLRSRGVGLKGNLRPLLELESGSNDPMAIFLTTAMIGLISDPSKSWVSLLPSLGVDMTAGFLTGAATGFLAGRLFDSVRLEYEGLYPVLGMSLVLLTFGGAEILHGNGFLAVYVCGIVLGNTDFVNKRTLAKFHDGLGWLMQIVLFLVLGLLVFPSRLPAVALPALIVSAFLMFVARPIAVCLGLLGSSFSPAQRTLVAWTGLRGAVPIVLATIPFTAGYERSDILFNMVFFIVLTSVLLQGRTLMSVARLLGVDEPLVSRPRYPLEFERTGTGMPGETREIDILPDAAVVGRRVSELSLPQGSLILLLRRGPGFVVPNGETVIEAFDTLLLIAEKKLLHEAQAILTASRDGEG